VRHAQERAKQLADVEKERGSAHGSKGKKWKERVSAQEGNKEEGNKE
jgi:hypothetical protein